ncbi:hypothetical protein Bca101_015820 [Brassica carinata]
MVMLDGDNFDDDDLMEDDELLYEENQKEKEIVSPGAMETTPNSREVPTDPIDNLEKETAEERQIGTGGGVTPYEPRHRREGSSSSRALQSPSLKKKGSPIPLTAGLSLKKRNFLLGRASPKLRESKVTLPPGPSPAMGNSTKMKDEDKSKHAPAREDLSPSLFIRPRVSQSDPDVCFPLNPTNSQKLLHFLRSVKGIQMKNI